MFNLEQSITAWRKQMLTAGIQTPVPLDELESHLRDEIEAQMQSGTNVQEAFEMAVQKIGAASALKTEFAKAGRTKKSNRWERRLVLFVLLAGVFPLGTYALFQHEMSLMWRVLGLANIGAIALAVMGWRFINQSFPVISNKQLRMAIGISCGMFGMICMVVFMTVILPRFEFTEGQLTVVVLWGLTLMAMTGVVLAGLEEAARRQNKTITT